MFVGWWRLIREPTALFQKYRSSHHDLSTTNPTVRSFNKPLHSESGHSASDTGETISEKAPPKPVQLLRSEVVDVKLFQQNSISTDEWMIDGSGSESEFV